MDRSDGVNARFRQLPAVDRLVERARQGGGFARWSLLEAAREVLESTRAAMRAGAGGPDPSLDALSERVRALARRLEQPFPRRVLNATGVVLHTNLGRAPLAEGAALAAAQAAAGYSDLELDLESGERGSRLERVRKLLCLLSGAEDALVVNNNAAALVLCVDALAAGHEVVLSRGELVEIGGSFRLPEILESSRARLREVGTTNRTHLRDYEQALGPETGLILKVHRSNFELRGFTHEVSLHELASLLRKRGIPLVEDRGSGTFLDLRPHGIPEREAWSGLREGADLVLFSGDKLLGGPQAGIVLGSRKWVEPMRRSPLARALRVDKLTLAALAWTLRALLEGRGEESLPVLRMLLSSAEELRMRAERLAKELTRQGWAKVSLESHGSVVGGGALPELELGGPVVRIGSNGSASELARGLRGADPPVLVRVHKDAVLVDPRTLQDSDLEAVIEAFASLSR